MLSSELLELLNRDCTPVPISRQLLDCIEADVAAFQQWRDRRMLSDMRLD